MPKLACLCLSYSLARSPLRLPGSADNASVWLRCQDCQGSVYNASVWLRFFLHCKDARSPRCKS